MRSPAQDTAERQGDGEFTGLESGKKWTSGVTSGEMTPRHTVRRIGGVKFVTGRTTWTLLVLIFSWNIRGNPRTCRVGWQKLPSRLLQTTGYWTFLPFNGHHRHPHQLERGFFIAKSRLKIKNLKRIDKRHSVLYPMDGATNPVLKLTV